jgi:N,N-dimethylformamidase beta subunit-like protein
MTTTGTVIASIAAGVAQDAAGNTNLGSTSTDNTVSFDAARPTVTINQASGQADPTSASPINFTVVFSEAVSGFTDTDITIGGTAGGAKTAIVSGGPSTYNVAVSGMTTTGTVIASIAAGVAQDAAGNTNLGSTSTDNTVSFDAARPTVTINQAAGQPDPTNASPINFTVVFSEAVSGFTDTDVTIGGTAGGSPKTVTVSGGPSTYNVAVSGMTTAGTVIASIAAGVAQDTVGNLNSASTSTDNTVTFDAGGPTVTINQAASQADPTSASPINFTVVFSEAVSGFTGTDVTISGTAGGSPKTVTVSGGPSTYNVAVSGMTTAGTVIAMIGAGVATDAAGNGNTASTSTDNSVAFDATPPTVTINQAASQADPTSASPIIFSAVFSEAVSGFTSGGVTIGGTAGGTKTVTVSGGPSTYDVAVSGMTTAGTVIATIAAGVATDAAGNANLASTSTDNSVAFAATGSGGGAAVTRVEESDPGVTFSANPIPNEWLPRGPEIASFSGGTAVSSNVATATATFAFTGRGVSWIGLKCNVCGIASVSIDGGAPVSVDTAGPAAPGTPGLRFETVFASGPLAAGPHTLKITVTGTSTSGGAHVIVDAFDVAGPLASLIAVENLQPGSENWQMWRSGLRAAEDLNKQIKGYASATSVNKGESITFHVTVTPAQQYTMDVYRMGWYQGLGSRLLQHIGPLQGVAQPACPVEPVTGLTECAWTATYALTVPSTWTSGVYLVQLTNAQGYQNYITFVVRDDARPADILFHQAVSTYQAYNNYPDDGATGKSLYDYNSRGANTATGMPRAAKVSWNRPYNEDGAGQFLIWEYPFVRWLERSAYDVTYSTSLDIHQNSARLLNSKAFLSVGHDEYWSKPMYDGVERARDAGVGLGFFGADAVYWQVRFEASPLNGGADRVMVGYKERSLDPVQGPTTTVLWRDPFLNRPEQQLIGVQFSGQQPFNAPNMPYVVTNSSSWVFEGTGLADGDSIPGIIGYEADSSLSSAPLPTSVAGTYQVLSQSSYVDAAAGPMIANSSIYQAPSGAWVFGAGTNSWSWGLDRPGFVDARIQRITANLLNRFLHIAPP